jgi:hypothetical protein
MDAKPKRGQSFSVIKNDGASKAGGMNKARFIFFQNSVTFG